MLGSRRRLVFACVVALAASASATASDLPKERLERLMAEHGAIRRQLAEAFPTSGAELAAIVADPDRRASASPAGQATAKAGPPNDFGYLLLAGLLAFLIYLMVSLRNLDF